MTTDRMTFSNFINNIITENLHPELRSIITSDAPSDRKHAATVKKIKDLTTRGETTGIEGNMPKGSSRAYMKHRETHKTVVDGKPAEFHVGTKVAIKSPLDKHHQAGIYDDMNLGQLQNHAENGDHFVNSSYRILTKKHDSNEFHSNKDRGILPPLVDHDDKTHHWSIVGHSRDIGKGEFRKLTKTPEFPKGISHGEFMDALTRDYNRNNGKHWGRGSQREAKTDRIEPHPLVQKFIDHQNTTGMPPHDYGQKKNMGIFTHPDGSEHIVARDSGFTTRVQHAYKNVRVNQALAAGGKRHNPNARLSAFF